MFHGAGCRNLFLLPFVEPGLSPWTAFFYSVFRLETVRHRLEHF